MGNELCQCWSNQDGTSRSAAPVRRRNHLEASLSDSIKQIYALDTRADALGDNEKTLESEADKLREQVDQETDPVNTRKLQQKLAKKNGTLKNVRREKSKVENMSHNKLLKRSNKVVSKAQEDVSKASAMNEELAHELYNM